MESYLWALIVISLSSVIVMVKHLAKSSRKRNSTLKGPIDIPLLGSLPHILLKVRFPLFLPTFEVLNDLRKVWGSTIRIHVGNYRLVIIDDLKLARKLMCSEDWSNRIPENDQFAMARSFGEDLGLLASNGESWKEMRRFVHKTMTKFGFGRSSALELRHEEEILSFFKYFDEKLSETGGVMQMQGIFNVAALNILWTMVASTRFDYESREIRELTELLEEFARAINPREMVFLALPWLRFIPGLTGHSKIVRSSKKLQAYFRMIINDRRESGNYKLEQNNFIDAFLLEIDNHKETHSSEPNYYTDEQLIMVLLDLFLTGFIPTASCLEYLAMFMVLNPKIQQKCQDEIDAVIGKNQQRYPSINDTENLPYVQAVCLEVLRKVTFIPITSRAATRDTYIEGHFVPKDTIAAINLYAIHNNPEIWDRPEEFRPERFLDENSKVANQETILPFGTGKRVCPAEVFGRLSSFTFFAYLLQNYTFENPPNCPLPDSTPNDGLGNYPKPFKALIKKQ